MEKQFSLSLPYPKQIDMKNRLLLALIAFLPLLLGAQADISGTWKGIITQNEGGFRANYDFEMVIKQEGKKITGRSYVRLDNIFCTMELEGEMGRKGYFRFKETRMVDSKKIEGLEWCIKRGQLLLNTDDEVWKLEGFWQGDTEYSSCIPGKVFLKKSVPRA